MLLRVPAAGSAEQAKLAQAGAKLETYETTFRNATTKHNRIVVPLQAVTASYKVLLFPFREGAELPATSWSGDGAQLTIAWGDQRDQVAFHTGDDGRSHLALTRDGKAVLEMK